MQSADNSNLYDQPIDQRPAKLINILTHFAESAFVSTIKLSNQPKEFIAYQQNHDFQSFLAILLHDISQVKTKYKFKRESMVDYLLSFLVVNNSTSEIVQRKEKELREKILQTLDSLEGHINEYMSLRSTFGLEEDPAVVENCKPATPDYVAQRSVVPPLNLTTTVDAKPPIPPPPPPPTSTKTNQPVKSKPRLPKKIINNNFANEICNQRQHLKRVDRTVSGGPMEKHTLPQIVTFTDYAYLELQKKFRHNRDNEE
ncbi:hypothetical protein HK103_005146 [Boothiomyces macroporosus]|uniref:Uncharacterized protein n=1 Tax=Boothiomyces macroporosus TaxID=261099 RepID=A0AAD5UFG1_9FUNG|nr:hypothetical protein HK103_005146 [Boothiomyces macroporosus]